MGNSQLQENFDLYFSSVLCFMLVLPNFYFGRKTGHEDIILDFKAFLIFPNSLTLRRQGLLRVFFYFSF